MAKKEKRTPVCKMQTTSILYSSYYMCAMTVLAMCEYEYDYIDPWLCFGQKNAALIQYLLCSSPICWVPCLQTEVFV